jgi:uncharacterized membrane protein YbaN (DUF454 family)
VNTKEAKTILMLHRPRRDAGEDPQLAAALEAARRDPELRQWLEYHRTFQNAMREKFRRIAPPPGLKEQILASHKIVRPKHWLVGPGWFSAAAAAVALFVGIAAFLWFQPASSDEFSVYRSRMVGTALREYRMDIVTNDLAEVRRFLATNNAPADYVLPPGLEHLELTGAGLLRWHNQPVSMVCFDRGDRQMVFLFVVDTAGIDSPPASTPVVKTVNKMLTAGWTEHDKTYLLAGPPDTDLLRSYFSP